MATNNYFGFPPTTAQYTAAPANAAYATPQTGYAVAPTANSAAYGAQRAATGYEAYHAGTHSTPATYAVTAPANTAAPQYDYSGYARTAATGGAQFDTSKAYYQQTAPAVTATQPYSTSDYQGKAAYNAGYTAQVRTNATATKAAYSNTGYVAPQGQAPQAATYTAPPNTIANTPNLNTPTFNAGSSNYSTVYPSPNRNQTNPAPKTKPAFAGTNFNQNKPAGNNSSWVGYKKMNSTNSKQVRTKSVSKLQQLHYCEVCKISCAGPQTFKEHLEGQRHKKKEALQKEGGTAPSTNVKGGHNLKCELCDVVCTGTDAYAAHLRGSKHQKVVKLHTKLAKPIPEVDLKSAIAAATGAAKPTPVAPAASSTPSAAPTPAAVPTPAASASEKINFVQSGNLETVKPVKEEAPTVTVKEEPPTPEVVIAEAPVSGEVAPVGVEYIEEIKNEEGKLISFHCKLCECKFNDPNAKNMHMKGRRHRLQFKKKVNPDLVVDVKPSGRRNRAQEERAIRRDDFLRRREMDGSFWADRIMTSDERAYWEERRRYEEEMEWVHRGGVPPIPGFIQPPFGMRRPETIDDRHFNAKHQAIYLSESKLQAIHKLTNIIESALKEACDQVCLKIDKSGKDTEGPKETTGTVKREDKEDPLIKSIVRVGLFPKTIFLLDDSAIDFVILSCEIPTKFLLNQVYNAFQTQIKQNATSEKLVINLHVDEANFTITTSNDTNLNFTIWLTSPVIRDSTSDSETLKKTEGILDIQKCLDALAEVRRVRWFQARPANNPSSVMVIRILRDLCKRNPTWAPLSEWALELLVDRVIGCAVFTGSEALRKVLEALAGGILLPGGPGIADPCERDPNDAAAPLTQQQRCDITASAQHALRLFTFRQIHKVLGMDRIVLRTPVLRFNRKRRRDNSSEEIQDSEVGDGKKDKKEDTDNLVVANAN